MLHVPIASPESVVEDALGLGPLPPDPRAEAVPLACLERAGRWSHATMRASSRHTIVHVTRGAGRIVMGGLRHGYAAGDAAFVPAGVMHAIDLPRGVQGTRFLIPAAMLPDASRTPRRARSPGSEAVAEAAAMAAGLAREIGGSKPGRERGVACRAGILALWIERESVPPLRLSAAEALCRDLAALVESRLGRGRPAGDCARALGVAPAELDAACRAAMGRAAEEVVTERLLHEAGRRLRRTDRPAAEIARRLGIGSDARLAHLLATRRGVAPEASRTVL